MKTLESCLAFESSDVAQFRLHVLNHYYKYGLKPAMDAFGVKKSTLYDWKRVLEKSKGRLVSLVPISTRPKTTRRMLTDPRLVEFIKSMRLEYGNVGANIIKPFLDEYAFNLGIPTIARATIEKLIKRRHLTFEKRTHIRRRTRGDRLRIKRSPKIKKPGHIQMDSITVYINREKHLFMSVIDVYTKLALVVKVSALSSVNAKRVLIKFQDQCPYHTHTVQTDNGSEFLASFHQYLEEQSIKHLFSYPRSPKTQSFVERFNRTIQEEFINRNDEIYYDLEAFQVKLTNYLDWYNYKRPHGSLKYVSPIQFINQIPKCG
jgi:transposase InsO family protein